MKLIGLLQLGLSPTGILAVVCHVNVVLVLEVGAVRTVKVTNPEEEFIVARIDPPPSL